MARKAPLISEVGAYIVSHHYCDPPVELHSVAHTLLLQQVPQLF